MLNTLRRPRTASPLSIMGIHVKKSVNGHPIRISLECQQVDLPFFIDFSEKFSF